MVAMAELNSQQAAALIESSTGRKCSRQNLEKLCRRGRLTMSLLSLKPIRLDEDTVVEDYLANVDPRQVGVVNHGPAKVRMASEPARSRAAGYPLTHRPRGGAADQLPDYNVSRARTEFEKANLLELDRKAKEGLLLPREQVERVWSNAVTVARTRLLGVPTRTRQRIPHLTTEEVAILEELIREALEELSQGDGDGN
jgi:hypothetical protein